jgi:hypothetical protein
MQKAVRVRIIRGRGGEVGVAVESLDGAQKGSRIAAR